MVSYLSINLLPKSAIAEGIVQSVSMSSPVHPTHSQWYSYPGFAVVKSRASMDQHAQYTNQSQCQLDDSQHFHPEILHNHIKVKQIHRGNEIVDSITYMFRRLHFVTANCSWASLCPTEPTLDQDNSSSFLYRRYGAWKVQHFIRLTSNPDSTIMFKENSS